MNRLQLIVLFFLLTSNICFGQVDYSAVLIDQQSHEPLSFVLVKTLNNLDTTTVLTDIEGRFTFRNRTIGNLRIIVNELGFSLLDTSITLTTHRASDTLLVNQLNLNNRVVRLFYNKSTALADIKAETIFLLLPGGLVGTKINATDTLFENKYKLKYISRGCIRFSSDNEREYNTTIFNYLDKKYGRTWRKEVRPDIIGLKQ
jgi:hypothetical protein